MPAEPHYEKQLAQLNREIEQLEAESKRLELERASISKQARGAARRFRYLTFLVSLRAPTAQLHLWPWAVLSVGPILVGVFLLILVNLITGSYPIAFFAF